MELAQEKKKTPSLKVNIIFNTLYQILIIITPLITTPYISRVIGPEGYGDFAFTQSIANYFFLFAMLGVNNYGNRVISQSRDDKELLSKNFWNIYSIQFFLSIIIIPGYLLYTFLFSNQQMLTLTLNQGLQIASVLIDVNWLLFGLEKFKISTIRNIIVKLLSIAAIFLFVRTSDDLNLYALIVGLGTVIGLVVILPSVFKEIKFVKPSFQEIKKHILGDLVLFLPLLATGIYHFTDKIMLGLLKTSEDVGYYSYANNIVSLPIALIVGVCTVVMPRVSNLAKTDPENSQKIINAGVFYILILSFAMAAGLFSVADVFVPIFLGDQYDATIGILKLLAFLLPIQSITLAIRMMYLIPYEKDNIYIISIFSGAIANVILNFIMISLFGTLGACYATIIANSVALVIQIILTWKHLPYFQWVKKSFPYLLISVLMSVGLFFFAKIFENMYSSLALQVVVGVVFFLASSFAMLLVQKEQYFMNGLCSLRAKLRRQ